MGIRRVEERHTGQGRDSEAEPRSQTDALSEVPLSGERAALKGSTRADRSRKGDTDQGGETGKEEEEKDTDMSRSQENRR